MPSTPSSPTRSTTSLWPTCSSGVDKLEGPQAIAVFPSSRSKETELFRRLFPQGLPPSADLMKELIKAIRNGKVDLAPKPSSGWYEYQIYALETFLLPEKGEENPKLLLTKAYKKRMLEAFQALMTKRRETHARDVDGQIGGSDRDCFRGRR